MILLTRVDNRLVHGQILEAWVPHLKEGHHDLQSVEAEAAIADGFDCAVITTDHSAFDVGQLAVLPEITLL